MYNQFPPKKDSYSEFIFLFCRVLERKNVFKKILRNCDSNIIFHNVIVRYSKHKKYIMQPSKKLILNEMQ